MNLEKFEDESFDGVYAIEATCHAPQREGKCILRSIFMCLLIIVI